MCVAPLNNSDWIDIVGIIVNAGLGLWIVIVLQSRMSNVRKRKDHFIDEAKEIRKEYLNFYSKLDLGEVKPVEVAPWFKMMNLRCRDLAKSVSKRQSKQNKIHSKFLPFRMKLRTLVDNLEEMQANYRTNSPANLSSKSKNIIYVFRQKYDHQFHEIIVEINDL